MEGKVIEVLQGTIARKVGDEIEVADRSGGVIAIGKVIGFVTGAGGCIYMLVRVLVGG